jgi:hypothetical protein
MRLWSRGLGRLVLPLELGKSRLDLTREHVVLSGTIREGKVVWDYRLRMTERDLLGFSRIACEPEVLDLMARHHGLGLLSTIAVRTLGFAWGLLCKAVGQGTPLVAETDDPPRNAREGETRRDRDGVLVEGTG